MTPTQCRAARALLDWSQPDLAEAAGVSLTTVVDFERSRRGVSRTTVRSIRLALENAGIEFDSNGGVRPVKGRRK
jgi:transcriptional regulator with XRE-family HTH domain